MSLVSSVATARSVTPTGGCWARWAFEVEDRAAAPLNDLLPFAPADRPTAVGRSDVTIGADDDLVLQVTDRAIGIPSKPAGQP